MTSTADAKASTQVKLGSGFSRDYHINSIYNFLNGADLPDQQETAVAEALFVEYRQQVNGRLSDVAPGAFWDPHNSSLVVTFEHLSKLTALTIDDVDELFSAAWQHVEGRYGEIESNVLAALDEEPADDPDPEPTYPDITVAISPLTAKTSETVINTVYLAILRETDAEEADEFRRQAREQGSYDDLLAFCARTVNTW